MKPASLIKSRFRSAYLGLFLLLCGMVGLFQFVVGPRVFEVVRQSRIREIESLISLYSDSLMLDDTRALRDYLVSSGVVDHDSQFLNLRPAGNDSHMVQEILKSCAWVTQKTCIGQTHLLSFQSAQEKSGAGGSSFAVKLPIDYFNNRSQVWIGGAWFFGFVISVLGLIGFGVRRQEVYFTEKVRLLDSSLARVSSLFEESPIKTHDEFAAAYRTIDFLAKELQERVAVIEGYKATFESKTRLERQFALSRQLAHDIRSPLTALEVILQDLGSIPEDRRVLVRSAVRRIQDVANGLLKSAKAEMLSAQGMGESLSKAESASQHDLPVDVKQSTLPRAQSTRPRGELLYVLVDELVSEKRLEFRSKLGVQIHFDTRGGYGVFAQVVEADLKRILSNLINNSVEALEHSKGEVTLKITLVESSTCRIEVRDTGVGIATEVLEKLGKVELSTKSGQDTKSGSGLGVLSSKRLVESWGGSLQIESELGRGSQVTLTLKTVPLPDWFCAALEFKPKERVAVVDDDQSIHSVWEERMRGLDVELHHYANPHQLMGAHKRGLSFDRYLIDYEFLGQTQNGLDLIEKEQIPMKSVLVTSRHNEPDVRDRARLLNVTIIPKALAAIVPVEVKEPGAPAKPTVVLLDDDSLIHMMWSAAASQSGLPLQAFTKWSDLQKWLSETPRSTDIEFYVDVELGVGELSGIDVAKEIFQLKRGPVYLATGHDPADFASHTFLAGVVGKAPPKHKWGA